MSKNSWSSSKRLMEAEIRELAQSCKVAVEDLDDSAEVRDHDTFSML